MNQAKLTDARAIAEERYAMGLRPLKLFSKANVKLKKGLRYGVEVYGLSLAPADASGKQLCPMATKECKKYCLFGTGLGGEQLHSAKDKANPTWISRLMKSLWFNDNPAGFMRVAAYEIAKLSQDAKARGNVAAFRLNVFSDICWEQKFFSIPADLADRLERAGLKLPKNWDNGLFSLLSLFPDTQFYDYTKIMARMGSMLVPPNYHLTYSRHEHNDRNVLTVLAAGHSVAVVTRSMDQYNLPYPLVDGDEHDLRYLDPKPCVVALSPKGALKQSNSPFVRDNLAW